MQLLAACGPAVPNSLDPPTGALLYLSAYAYGKAVYDCVDGKVGALVDDSGTIDNPEGWTGDLFVNKDGYLQMDLGIKLVSCRRMEPAHLAGKKPTPPSS